MKVKNIRKIEIDGRVSIVADCKIRTIGWDTVYFSFDRKYEDFLRYDSSPFAATLLIPSMCLGQDLSIEGSISEALYEGMMQTMEIMVSWDIGLKRINIHAEKIMKDDVEPARVASFFSGGVDSFYTYLKHKSDAIDRISHFVLIHGTDIDLDNSRLWTAVRNNVRDIAKIEDIGLIDVETNIQLILEPILSPEISHGGTLAAVALCLRSGIKKIYIPASWSSEDMLLPWGSHPDIDKNWSTETLLFEHDGFESNRVNKVLRFVGQSPLALEHLRVCFMNVKNTYNCGKCEKCLRTMMNLYAVGRLSEAKTFPQQLEPGQIVEVIRENGKACSPGFEESIAMMRTKNIDPELCDKVTRELEKAPDKIKTRGEIFFKRALYFDHMYFRGVLYRIWRGYIRDYVRQRYAQI